jgi:hypothetical protein
MATSPAGPETAARGVAVGLLALRLAVAVGLAVDAYVHIDLATAYAGPGGVLNEQNLFLVEAGAAIVAAVVVLAARRRAAALVAVAVAASALAAVLSSRYVDLGAIGPFPDLYEPVWYPEKAIAAVGEALAMLAAVLLMFRLPRGRGHDR